MAKSTGRRYGIWIIMILLFVGLLGFGTGGLSGNLRSIGTVGDKDVTVAQYQSELRSQLRAIEAQFGQPITFQQAREFGIDRVALAAIVQQRALDNEATELGLSVGDERVRDEVLRVPAFTDLQGNFDRDAYALALRQNGLTEAAFEASLREDISRTLLQGAVIGGIPAPEPYAEALVAFVGEERRITTASVTQDDLIDPVPGPTEDDIAAYYEANPEQFTLPETRDISYAILTPEMIQDDLTVDEGSLRELYEERRAEFVQPERRLVERLVFAGEEQAQAALARLTANEISFDDLVEERGLDLADIDLGDVSRDDLGAAGDVVFAAQAGDVVGPANSSIGPALFRVNAVLAAEEVTFEDAAPDLRAELASARARRVIQDMIEDINDRIASGFTIEDLAEQTDLELGEIQLADGDQDGVAAYEEFREAAAALTEGAFAEITDLADGGIAILRLDGVTPPALQPLDDVRETARRGAQDALIQEAVMARAEALAAQIDPLTTFETLGLQSTVTENLTRRGFVEGTPPGFVEEVFEMEIAGVRVIDRAGDGAIIVRLDNISAPAEDDPRSEAELEAVAATAAQGIAQDIFDAYSRALQSRTDISIDDAAVNAVNAQFQ